MKRTILSATAICAIAVGFVLPSTSFAATQRAHGDPNQPDWYQTDSGDTDNGAGSSPGGNLSGNSIQVLPIYIPIIISGNQVGAIGSGFSGQDQVNCEQISSTPTTTPLPDSADQ